MGVLGELRRACRPGGVVAARDGDYPSMVWTPVDEELDRWLGLYTAVARAAGGEPAGGRWLATWAHRAGFREVSATASTWLYVTADERR